MPNYPLWDQLNQLKEATWVDLTHTFDLEIPRFSEFEKGEVSTLFTVKEHGFYVQRWNIVTQYGTLHLRPIPADPVSRISIAHAHETKLPFQANGRIEEGTFVALRTDWSKRWPDIEQFENKDAEGNQHLPGWGLDALKFLIEERGVKSIGHETFDTDASVDTARNGDIVGERYILGQDTFQLELLTNLDQLPTRGAVIYAISPKPKDAPGFPSTCICD